MKFLLYLIHVNVYSFPIHVHMFDVLYEVMAYLLDALFNPIRRVLKCHSGNILWVSSVSYIYFICIYNRIRIVS